MSTSPGQKQALDSEDTSSAAETARGTYPPPVVLPPGYPPEIPPPVIPSWQQMQAKMEAAAGERAAREAARAEAKAAAGAEAAGEARAKAWALQAEAAEAEAAARGLTGTWPPEIPPRKQPEALAVYRSWSELAGVLLYDHRDDYRYATDLRCWIERDGDRWVPAPLGVSDIITGIVNMTGYDEWTATDPGVRRWVREGCRGAYEVWTGARETRKATADSVRVQDMLAKLMTPAGQARLAALMKNQAGTECDPCTVRASELDAEPHILWAGSVPIDLAKSVSEPVWAEEVYGTPAPRQLTGREGEIIAFILERMNTAGVGRRDLTARFGMSTGEADRWLDRDLSAYESGVRSERWPMTLPHMKSANYCPDIRVGTPIWDELTAAIFPDVNEREHALNSLSHGLHGYPTEAAALARSATGTGKSFLASLISDLLGDYAGQVAAKTLFGNGGNAQFAFNEMHGARFVVMNEGRKADFASTEAFKAVVGPDPLVNARARHERTGRMVPAHHTMFLTVNPAADLDYSDPAVVRRLIPLGFTGNPVKIKAIAKHYGTKNAEGYAAWQAEAPGVLAKLIVRCAHVLGDPSFYGTREDMPESIGSRWAGVVAEADPFGRWMDERTGDGLPTPNDDLLEDYQRWCKLKHEVPLNPAWFGRAMASRGIERYKIDRDTRGWRIALRP